MIQRLSLNSQCFGVLLWCDLNPPANKEEVKKFKITDSAWCLGCF